VLPADGVAAGGVAVGAKVWALPREKGISVARTRVKGSRFMRPRLAGRAPEALRPGKTMVPSPEQRLIGKVEQSAGLQTNWPAPITVKVAVAKDGAPEGRRAPLSRSAQPEGKRAGKR